MRIALAVQGRLHAFDLAKALAARPDVHVRLLTNYSHRECSAFGIPPACATHHFTAHRWLQALTYRALRTPLPRWADHLLHASFGQWTARTLASAQPPPHVIRLFSGIATETLAHPRLQSPLRILTRGSSHIQVQRQLLDAEMQRAGCPLDRPSDYMIARETAEYAAADQVLVLSRFAYDTFLQQGHPPSRLWLLPNAADPTWYGATPAMQAARRARILSGAPLRVLTVGAFSFRKGILDLATTAQRLAGAFEFRFVGDQPAEGHPLRHSLHNIIQFRDRVPPQQLREEYAWGDVFLFPTIEDGFPATLSQALAAGLPAITTPNGSGPDVILQGRNGWIVPIRSPDTLINTLQHLSNHRTELADSADFAARHTTTRTWATVADDFVQGCRTQLGHASR